MTPSDTARAEAVARLNELCARLDEGRLYARIDRPVRLQLEQSLARLQEDRRDVVDVLAEFTQLLNGSGPWRRALSRERALDEAIGLLERGYVTADARGCVAAWHDLAKYGCYALRLILESMAMAFRDEARAAYIAWLSERSVASAAWPVRCAMVQVLRDRAGDHAFASLRECTCEELAPYAFELASAVIASSPASVVSAWAAAAGGVAFAGAHEEGVENPRPAEPVIVP